ncbi:MAG: DUF2911 domain-containing protein [Microscillaceae bacterium]|nr:DUF2911 domain-containing protein [Microscillaceae bacterium]
MKKIIIRVFIGLGILAVVLFIAFQILISNTKKHSPEDTVVFKQGDTEMTVFYCKPSKKGRVIFGELVPYKEVWRTGANEATTFTTNKALKIGDKTLEAGKYTIWTIPDEKEWTVIFNKKQYGWGVGFNQKASRDPESDVIQFKTPVEKQESVTEQFTISFEKGDQVNLNLAWDQVKVSVPMEF